ncbi:NACHT, LRR and PYD domains-containing protein 3-like, partial [Clarias magur]
VQELHKEVMRNGVAESTQVSSLLKGQSIKDVILNKCYIPLTVSVEKRSARTHSMRKTLDLERVISQVFGADTEGGKLLLCGGPGMGKTTAVEHLIWDWASGIHLQRYTFIMRLCSKVLRGPEHSLQNMLLSTHPHISAEHLQIILKMPHTLLLVSDHVQSFLSNPPESDKLLCDPDQPAGGNVLLHSLLEGTLLPGVSLLLTSREDLQLESVRLAHLMGFSSSQRKAYFQRFFNDKNKGKQILRRCEQAVGVNEICASPGLCWTLCCVCKERLQHQRCVPETLSELYCMIIHTLLQEHKVNVEAAKELVYGLGKLSEECTSDTFTHSDIIKCGLRPFLGSQILSAILRVNSDDVTSPEATYSFTPPTMKDFLGAVSFYLDQDDTRSLENPMEIHNYHFFLAGLSDPMQRKLLETCVGLLSSSRLSEFHSWLMRTVAEVLPEMNKTFHWHVLRILHHTLSPTLVRESVGSCKWRLIGYGDMQDADCAAMAFVVRCLGELQELNLYNSSLTEEQAEKLMAVFRLAESINLSQSKMDMGVIRHVAGALKEGRATDVDLKHCKLGDEAIKILCSSITHSRLHRLDLWDCGVTLESSEAIAEMLSRSKLRDLNLGANNLNDEGLIRLVGALGTSTCTLQTLSFDLCPLTGSCLAALSSALTSSLSDLRNLVLRRNSLVDDTLEHLSKALQSGRCKLNTLSLDSCELTGSCGPALAAALHSEHCCLTELDLSVNEFDESSAFLICDALKSPSCSLEKISMAACELTAPVFSALGSVLVCEASRLKELSIGVNRVGDAAVKHVLKALKHPHCRLQHLDLEMVHLTDACLDELCEGVMACGSLTSLILKNNILTDVSVPRLVKLVQERPVLELKCAGVAQGGYEERRGGVHPVSVEKRSARTHSMRKTLDLERVISQVFGADTEGGKLLLCGGPGMGKTTAVEHLIWDWASGIHLQRYTFIMRLCSKVLRGPEHSLQNMLLSTHPHISAEHLDIILKMPHTLLLVSDHVQSFLSNPPESDKLLCDPDQPAGGNVLLHSLLEGTLLPGVSLLLTSREDLQLESVRLAHLMGFSSSQRKAYFQRFFNDKNKGKQILRRCEQAVGVNEICASPGLCWTLCCVCKERLQHQRCVPETLSELYCMIIHTLLQEHKVNVEAAKELVYGLGKLSEECTSDTFTHSDIIKCGLRPFLGSQILSAILRVNSDDVTSPEATYSFTPPTMKDFLGAVSFYLDQDDTRSLENPMEIHNYHFFLAGLSDPMQRKLLETCVGLLSSSRLSEFHSWLMRTVAEVLPEINKTSHWHVLRILHHTLSPTLVRESVGSCKWRLIGYGDMQDADCAAMAFVVRCLGELQELNLYNSSLTEEQAEKLMAVFRLAESINLSQSKMGMGVIRHVARALKEGRATDVDLKHCNLGDKAIKILCSSITHSRLHRLDLRACGVTLESSETIAEMLSRSKLHDLSLAGNNLKDDGLIRLVGALGTSTCTLQML